MHLVKVTPKIFGMGFKICGAPAWTSLQQVVSRGAIIGVVCYERGRTVAYSAYIFKALGVYFGVGSMRNAPLLRGTNSYITCHLL